ncbi:hypothetical protein EAI30_11960 [Romboutsia ilealis]|uniref:Polymerase beta nucleotidyltransferase domain-containing protein n=1 Tax=Romboutsia faecis TaxID=2764597 RepID=A0ABR7JS31_9FIRM|nr:hypothetical protein [Romboutsia faecis]MBC5997719.1 hypothetical protein [Romboutsia faecis]MRN25333.1 hypothetical protein [Romboutsia ilealis]
MTNKIYEICKLEIEKLKQNSNTIAVFLVGSAKNIDLKLADNNINDIDIFVFVNQGENQVREIKRIEGIEFDINYFSRRGFKHLMDNKEYFFLNGMKDAKVIFDRNNTATGIIQLCRTKYQEGPNLISEGEKCFLKSEIESNISRLKNKEKFDLFEYEFLVNLYLKELIVGYFTINNKWIPKDKKLLKELKKENSYLYDLVNEIKGEEKYEKLLEIYDYIFKDIVMKNYIKITY